MIARAAFGLLGALALAGSAGALRGGAAPLRNPSPSRGIRMLPGASGRVRPNLEPGTLILVRNGLPDWGLPDEQYIGWADPDLSEEGQMQVRSAARLLVESGHTVDIVHTSMMKRSIRTVWIILHELERIYLPVLKDWRLAARRCGALTGLSAATIERHFGPEYLAALRTDRSLVPPVEIPGLSPDDYSATRERRFAHLDGEADVHEAESLSEALARCEPAWTSIAAELSLGKNVLVVGHQLSLSSLVAKIEGLGPDETQRMIQIPRGCPLIYKFERSGKGGKLVVSAPSESEQKLTEQRGAAFAATEEGEERPAHEPFVPAYADFLADPADLERMSREQTPLRDAPTCVTSGAFGTELCTLAPDDDGALRGGERARELERGARAGRPRGEQVVVIIRHGKTEHNKLGLFTGWEDVPLATEGAAEAMYAGRLLALHGIEFDLVYASWLSRSISTAWLVLEQLDALWLPIVKSWRLNERMYGALTSLSKRMIRTKYGEKQFKQWRRGYSTRPPPVSSFSPLYPGNDRRYVTYVTDVRASVRESLIRSIEAGKLELHPKLPKSESLRDCMERTIPYWRDVIVPEAIEQGKSVLISSSENAIRGLIMHLCDIPAEQIVGVEIPTGVPLIYDVRSKCIRLLDDPSSAEPDPLKRYNFGSNGHLLFQPCQLRYDEEQEGDNAAQPGEHAGAQAARAGEATAARRASAP